MLLLLFLQVSLSRWYDIDCAAFLYPGEGHARLKFSDFSVPARMAASKLCCRRKAAQSRKTARMRFF
jgi:hypothetical protein